MTNPGKLAASDMQIPAGTAGNDCNSADSTELCEAFGKPIISPYGKPAITPPAGHPRLLLTEKDLPRIKDNFNRPENQAAVDIYNKLLTYPITGTGATPEYGTYNLGEALACEALGFRALLSGKEEDSSAAVEKITLLLDNLRVDGGNMGARWSGHLIFVCAEIYDWCYKYISAETGKKLIARCEEIATEYFEMGYPPAKQTAISGHGTEAQLLRDLMAFSVAVYDERPDIYNFCAGRIFDEYIPAVGRLLESGAHNQGPTYGSYRFTSLCICDLIFRSMSGHGVFDCLEKTGEWLLYMTRPDGEDLRLGDAFNENKAEYNRKAPFCVPFFWIYALTGRADFYEEFSRGFDKRFLLPEHLGMDYYGEGSWGEGLISAVQQLIFDGFSGRGKKVSLPDCRYFGSPVGETVFKKGDTYIFMKAGIFWGANHDHLDTGCFQVYRGVPLLTDSGVYDRYSSPHRKNYLTHTGAHNCITVERTDRNNFGEWKPDIAYDGGTRRPAKGQEAKTVAALLSAENKMAEVLSHSESETSCSLVTDMSAAYMHSCSRAVRSVTYDHELHCLTVRDEIDSLDKDFVKTFHLHCQTEPEIRGNTVTIESRGYKAICRVLEPKDAVIKAIGGPGHRFEIDGSNFEPEPPYVAEEGWGEIRISPAGKRIHDVFLVSIETFGKG